MQICWAWLIHTGVSCSLEPSVLLTLLGDISLYWAFQKRYNEEGKGIFPSCSLYIDENVVNLQSFYKFYKKQPFKYYLILDRPVLAKI